MANKTTHTCDRCGGDCDGRTYIDARRNHERYRFNDSGSIFIDLCDKCFSEFKTFLHKVKPRETPKVEPRESTKETEAAQREAPATPWWKKCRLC